MHLSNNLYWCTRVAMLYLCEINADDEKNMYFSLQRITQLIAKCINPQKTLECLQKRRIQLPIIKEVFVRQKGEMY